MFSSKELIRRGFHPTDWLVAKNEMRIFEKGYSAIVAYAKEGRYYRVYVTTWE